MIDDSPLRTSDGIDLAGDVALPDSVRAGVVLTHPHPDYGGDRRALVPDALFRLLPQSGIAALRFDFRGAGQSGGSHSHGRDEPLDVLAAIDELERRLDPGTPLVLVGYSFGADIALRVDDRRLAGRVVIAPPLHWLGEGLALDARPVLALLPEHDQFNPPARASSVIESWPNAATVVVRGADHFLAAATQELAELIDAFVAALVPER